MYTDMYVQPLVAAIWQPGRVHTLWPWLAHGSLSLSWRRHASFELSVAGLQRKTSTSRVDVRNGSGG